MNKRFASVFVFALVVSGIASLLVYRLVASRIAASAKPVGTAVLVAVRDLPLGTMVRAADVKEQEWAGQVPPRVITDRKNVEERGVISAIYSGEPILEDRLAPKGAGAGLAATIPQGMRAVAVRVNEVVGLAGFVTPGMRVDIVVMGHSPGSNQQGSLSKTILQNIEVLSAGQQIQKDAEGKPVQVQVVNMLVTPSQAETLSLASNEARIQLVLRNPLDKEVVKTAGTALSRLFSDPTAPPPVQGKARPAPKKGPPPPAVAELKTETQKVVVPIVIEVIHGAKKAEVKFKQDDAPKAQ